MRGRSPLAGGELRAGGSGGGAGAERRLGAWRREGGPGAEAHGSLLRGSAGRNAGAGGARGGRHGGGHHHGGNGAHVGGGGVLSGMVCRGGATAAIDATQFAKIATNSPDSEIRNFDRPHKTPSQLGASTN